MVTFSISHLPVLSNLTKSIYQQLILFISAHGYLCACRVSIQDSSKHCFLLHSLCMVGIKTYVGPNSSQLQQPWPLLPPVGRGNPRLCSWPEPFQMQQLQKGLSCPPSPSPWPVLLLPGRCWPCRHAAAQCWKMVLFARWASSQINSLIQPLSPTHGNGRVLNKLRLAINTQRWVTAETLYSAVHLFKANHCQIRSA